MKRFLTLILASFIALAALPAAAQQAPRSACPPDYIVSAGFIDVSAGSTHFADINCLAWWQITDRETLFSPYEALPRWEMADWMASTAAIVQWMPTVGAGFFSDVGSLSTNLQLSVEQIRLLDITQGVGGTNFDPYGAVPRWQMALFLTRLTHATGRDLPLGNYSPFYDLAGVPVDALIAINQLAEIGITTGTSPTTFSPFDVVTREQMASFVARTLEYIYAVHPFSDSCSVDAEGVEVCTGYNWAPHSATAVRLRSVSYVSPEYSDWLRSGAVEVFVYVDGQQIPANTRTIELGGISYLFTEVVLFDARWLYQVDFFTLVDGELVLHEDYVVDFTLGE